MIQLVLTPRRAPGHFAHAGGGVDGAGPHERRDKLCVLSHAYSRSICIMPLFAQHPGWQRIWGCLICDCGAGFVYFVGKPNREKDAVR